MNKTLLIQQSLQKGYLLSPDILDAENIDQQFLDLIEEKILSKEKPIILNKDLFSVVQNNNVLDINWLEFEKSKARLERGKKDKTYSTFLELLQYNQDQKKRAKMENILKEVKQPEKQEIEKQENNNLDTNVVILHSFKEDSKKREIQDFVLYYKKRYEALQKMIYSRPEMQDAISIMRLENKENNEIVSIIGLVYDKHITKNGNVLLTIEDTTGHMKALVNKNNNELFQAVSDVCVDEVIGLKGNLRNKIVFANALVFPDVPKKTELKQFTEEVYVAFISDIHVGSKMFLEEEFKRFIKWLNGEVGNTKQRAMAQRVKYLLVTGDLVDGIGVFPGQEDYLALPDLKEQYLKLAELLQPLRKDLRVIISPGQHDATRNSEPQPVLDKDYTQAIWDLSNVTMVSNPALVNLHATPDFEGFNILMYHGASFHYFIDSIPSLREKKSRDNPCQVHKFLLKKRHLAPSHASTVYVPSTDEDPLVITKVPDIMVCGDMHKSDVGEYNGVITINSSCWQAKTDFQEKTGNNPDPCKVPLFNLQTREVKFINFSKDQEQ